MKVAGLVACISMAVANCGPATTASSDCPVERADVAVAPTSGKPGSMVQVSGPLYYRNQEGEVWVPDDEEIQAWWNLDPADYARAATAAVEAANGGVPAPLSGGIALVGSDEPEGACSFDLLFPVPGVGPGTYPVSIVAAVGSDGSTTVYGSFPFEVR